MTLSFAPERIETWPLARLRPYAKNAKEHGADQVAKIAASMAEFGWTVPCLVADDGELIAGHGRVLAATQLGLTEAPVIVLGHLSEAQRRAYRIADNKLTELGDWNEALLSTELNELLVEDFDLSLVGFSDAELEALLAGEVDPETASREGEDDVPEAPETPISRPGDLWELGKHRLLCGDATVATDVERLLGDVTPLLMVTDPPYGVDYDPGWRNKVGAAVTRRTGKVLNDDRADWREAWALFPGDVAYVWHGALHATTVAESLEAAGFNVRSQIIWAKDRLVLSRGDYHWQHEPCWYAVNWLAIPLPAAGKGFRGGKITPGEWERRRGLRLRFVYRRRGPSLLVADRARINKRGQAVASRSKTGRNQVSAPIFLLVPQVKLPKRLDLDRDAERALDKVPGLIVANWVEGPGAEIPGQGKVDDATRIARSSAVEPILLDQSTAFADVNAIRKIRRFIVIAD